MTCLNNLTVLRKQNDLPGIRIAKGLATGASMTLKMQRYIKYKSFWENGQSLKMGKVAGILLKLDPTENSIKMYNFNVGSPFLGQA